MELITDSVFLLSPHVTIQQQTLIQSSTRASISHNTNSFAKLS